MYNSPNPTFTPEKFFFYDYLKKKGGTTGEKIFKTLVDNLIKYDGPLENV